MTTHTIQRDYETPEGTQELNISFTTMTGKYIHGHGSSIHIDDITGNDTDINEELMEEIKNDCQEEIDYQEEERSMDW